MMQSELKGSPVKVYKLHREAAPMGGLIAMDGNTPVATCVKDGERWTIRLGEEIIATFEGNTSSAALALHLYLMGRNFMLRTIDEIRKAPIGDLCPSSDVNSWRAQDTGGASPI